MGAETFRERYVTKMQFQGGVSNKLQKCGGGMKQTLIIFLNFINILASHHSLNHSLNHHSLNYHLKIPLQC